jgi:hypothetical protein
MTSSGRERFDDIVIDSQLKAMDFVILFARADSIENRHALNLNISRQAEKPSSSASSRHDNSFEILLAAEPDGCHASAASTTWWPSNSRVFAQN